MQVEIRPLKTQDLDRVCELESLSFSMPWKRDDFEELISNDESRYLVIVVDGEVCGTAGYTYNGYEGYVNNVVIDSNYRGKGLGKQLMQELIATGRKEGISEFTLEVRVSNEPANRLYEGLGFVSEGIRKNFYEKPTEDAYVRWLRY